VFKVMAAVRTSLPVALQGGDAFSPNAVVVDLIMGYATAVPHSAETSRLHMDRLTSAIQY
jgi:hypothetical protein